MFVAVHGEIMELRTETDIGMMIVKMKIKEGPNLLTDIEIGIMTPEIDIECVMGIDHGKTQGIEKFL